MHPMMKLKTMITCSKNSFDHKCHYAFWVFLQITERDLRILSHPKMELFMAIGKGCILDVASVSRLCDSTIYWIGLMYKSILYYWFNIRKILQCKIFFNVFEIIRRLRMHKYQLFWRNLIYLNIRTLHKVKTYTKIFTPFQIIMTSRVINQIISLVYISQTGKIFAMVLTKMI